MRIVLIGTGNLATRLGIALRAGNVEIVQVFGRTPSAAATLARQLDCEYTCSKANVTQSADLYILAVSDGAILDAITGMDLRNKLMVHTAGSVDLKILASITGNYGVFYPVQTLSAKKEIDFTCIPVCIEANNAENLEKLRSFALLITSKVLCINSSQRKYLHLAAVFASNFVNHFYAISEKIMADHRLDFQLLNPLILETAAKATQSSPHTVQTGPAMRNDKAILDQHIEMLAEQPELRELYDLISKDILNHRLSHD